MMTGDEKGKARVIENTPRGLPSDDTKGTP